MAVTPYIISYRVKDEDIKYLGYVNLYSYASYLIKSMTEERHAELTKAHPLVKFTAKCEILTPESERWTITSVSQGWIYDGAETLEYEVNCFRIEPYIA